MKPPLKKRMGHWLLKHAAPYLLVGLLRLIYWTLRMEKVGDSSPSSIKGPILYGYWHGRMFALPHAYRPRPGRAMHIMISSSRDGEFVARVARLLGYDVVRGSSRRGGLQALAGMMRVLKGGDDASITLDGPVGPCCVAKPGLVMLARKSGVPIIPVAVGYTRCWSLKSWDRFVIPKPFSRVVVVYGVPMTVEKGLDAEGLEAMRLQLEQVVNRMTREADVYAADPEGWGPSDALTRPWAEGDPVEVPDHPPRVASAH